MFSPTLAKWIPIIICVICIGIVIYIYYQSKTTSSTATASTLAPVAKAPPAYDILVDKVTDPSNHKYYKLHIDESSSKPIVASVAGKSDEFTVTLKKIDKPAAEGFIANLKNLYTNEHFSKCDSGLCNSKQNEWIDLSGPSKKSCNSPGCSEHFTKPQKKVTFDTAKNGLYDAVYIEPESYKTIKSGTNKQEMYTDLTTTPSYPRVDMKDKLRAGAPILRGDVQIVPTGYPIIGASKLRHEELTPALFY